ncbi:MAG: tetratricopeptide repeat protein [Prevotella sp.]|nr:tetratricopeptide repeat protein [Prevotella sp.]
MPQRGKFYESQEFKEKLQIYEDAKKQGESVYLESDDLVDIAEYYHLFDSIDKSIEAVEYAIQLFPSATAPLVFRARVAFMIEHDVDKAKQYVDMIEDTTDLDYYYIKMEIMLVENHVDDAEGYLQDVYAQLDEETQADFVIDVAALYIDYSYFSHAKRWLDLSDEYEEDDYQELKGEIAYGLGNYEESEEIFNGLLDKDPFSSFYWNKLAAAQYMRGDMRTSIQSSEFALAIDPDDYEATLNKANCLYSLGNYEEALKYYERYSYILPDNALGEMYVGMTLYNLGRVEEAIERMRKAEAYAIEYDEDLHVIYMELAYYLSMVGQYDEAMEYLEGAKGCDVVNPAELMVLEGIILLRSGKEEEGLELFNKAIESSAHSPVIILRVATYIYESGIFSLAYQVFHSLLDHAAEDWRDGWSYLAYCCKALCKDEEYLATLSIACKRNPVEVKVILGHLFPESLSTDEYVEYAKQHQQLTN